MESCKIDPIFFDTETVGLHGPIVLLQYAVGLNGPVKLVSLWKLTVGQAIEELETLINHPGGVVGFNIVFDWFHVCQMYTTLLEMPDWSAILEDSINDYAMLEPKARLGPCCKPVRACDLMLHARKGPYQAVMDRGDIRIRRVPTQLAWPLADELEKRIKFKPIFFGKKKHHDRCWQVYDLEDAEGKTNKDFKDVVLKFAATSALKAIATDVFGLNKDDVLTFSQVELKDYPKEYGYAPFALAVGSPDDWKGAWPEIIHRHITHWSWHPKAREYAELDVIYLQKLYPHFGSPELGDNDSELACMVAAVRWRGFGVNIEGLKKLRETAKTKNRKMIKGKGNFLLDPVEDMPGHFWFKIPTSPAASRKYIEAALSPMEQLVMEGSTKKPVLEKMQKWRECKICPAFYVEGGERCEKCNNELYVPEASIRAREILEARQCNYEVDFYDKIIRAGRFHASSSIIGSLSGRMAGGGSAKGIEQGGTAKGDGVNPLGVKRTKEVRQQFPLADNGLVLCGGDFGGFEVTLAEALYGDDELRKDLQSGKKIHALFGQFLYRRQGLTYEQIVKSAGTSKDYYDKCKRAFFATLYGAEKEKLSQVLEVSVEEAAEGLQLFGQRYPKVGEYQSRVNAKCCSMRQPGGIGTKVEWHDPAEFAESMFGFRRYYTLENMIAKALFGLACDPPKKWKEFKVKVSRRDRIQSAYGALQSSLYGAAFSLQAANMRSYKNHEIQASGAEITKDVQRKIWDLQPAGVHPWLVQPLNVHDEIQCPTHPSVVDKVASIVNTSVESYRARVPLIKMDWDSHMSTWADKS